MRAVLSHESAAAWLGADLPTPAAALHVTAPRNRGRRANVAPGVRLHRADLSVAEVIRVRGVRVTAPERTVIDVARSLCLEHAVAIADGLCRSRRLDLSKLTAAVTALPIGPGHRALHEVVALIDPRAGSVFESITRVSMAAAGLPAPCTQYDVHGQNGRWIGRVDFAWPESKLILECDGFEFHGDRGSFERDRRRWTALVRAGWRVAIVTWHDVVGDRNYLIEVVADLLAA